ncbi:hypothetical protein CAPTEDRAFT_74631, partial [Capitella teleta]
QKWVFYESEAPTNVWNYVDKKSDIWKKFNITATFTSDSNIPLEFHRMICTRKDTWKPSSIDYAASKRKKVAWFVSHCDTSSRRELYAKALAKYIDIDIFGKCGNDSVCSSSGPVKRKPTSCMTNFINDYKFYLSFENAFCQEYYTEKLHEIIKANVIPIVLGKADYASILPKETYMDIRDYESPADLGRRLTYLDKNDKLYNAQLEARTAYSCNVLYSNEHSFQCKLCEYL